MSNLRSRYRTWRAGVALLAAGGAVALACSSPDATNNGGSGGKTMSTGGTTSAAGASAKGGTGANGGSTSAGTGGSSAAMTGGTGGSGTSTGVSGGTSMLGGSGAGGTTSAAGAGGTATAGAANGGAPSTAGSSSSSGGAPGSGGSSGGALGSGGAHAGGASGTAGAGGSSTASFTCNEIIGIDSTSEWYTAGFENQVTDGKWQLLSYHPGYVEDWGNASDAVWSMATLTSPCTTNSDNPDRVIYNMFADGSDSSITNETAFAAGLAKVITQIKAHYSRVKRIDLLTMTRAPMNVACSASNAAGSMIPQYYDDAVTMEVASGPPQIIASPPFFAPDCTVFDDTGGPHFSDAGKPIIAKLYGDYYSAEP